MGRVMHPNQKPEYTTGKSNTVTGVVPAQLLAVAFVDADGRKSMCLAVQFGKDTNDGGPAVFIMADEEEMKNQLKIANATITKGVRAWMSKQRDATAEELPANLDVGALSGPPSDGDLDIGALDLSGSDDEK